jgi:hypothetical protein
VLGRHVRTLLDRDLKPGFHKIEWNGVNDADLLVASGVYHAVLRTQAGQFTTKMVVLR